MNLQARLRYAADALQWRGVDRDLLIGVLLEAARALDAAEPPASGALASSDGPMAAEGTPASNEPDEQATASTDSTSRGNT